MHALFFFHNKINIERILKIQFLFTQLYRYFIIYHNTVRKGGEKKFH